MGALVGALVGHGDVLHARTCSKGPVQFAPPLAAATLTLRERVSVPPAHEAVQSLHSLHADSAQSVAHTRSDVAVGATDSCCTDVHVVSAAHCVSAVAVHGATS